MALLPAAMAERLFEAASYSREGMRAFREHREHRERQIVGYHYTDEGAGDRQPVNMLELARTTYMTNLVAQTPRADVSARQQGYQQLRATAQMLEVAINNTLDDIGYGEELENVVRDALTGMGIMCMGLSSHDETVEIDGVSYDPGRVMCGSIDLTDFVLDMTAKSEEGCQFKGHRYRLPYDYVMGSKLYKSSAKMHLEPTPYDRYDDYGLDRIESLSGLSAWGQEDVSDQIELWDFYMPHEGENGLVVTAFMTFGAAGEAEGRVLRVMEWEGHEDGPYRILSFAKVPNNVLPLPPMAHLVDLADLGNTLFRKLARQADRQKRIGLGRAGSAKDVRIVKEAEDGEVVLTIDPEAFKEAGIGGIDPNSNLFFMQVRDLWSYFGGNVDALAGLAQQGDTFGQERMISTAASKRMQKMQQKTAEFAAQDMKAIGWYLFTDPLLDLPVHIPSPRGTVSVPVRLTAQKLMGDFYSYNFDIQPFSLQYLSPSEKLQVITSVFERFIIPYLSVMMQEGKSLQFGNLLKLIAKNSNVPEIAELYSDADDMKEEPMFRTGGDMREQIRSMKPPTTTRRVERTSSKQSPQRERQSAMMQSLTKAAGAAQAARS